MRTGVAVLIGLGVLGVAGAVAFVIAGGKVPPQVAAALSPLASASSASDAATPSASTDAGTRDAGADAAVKVQAAPLSSAQLSAPFMHATFLATCGAPPTMKVTIKATVRQGRAVDVHATTDPPDPVIAGCLERAATDLRWDASRKTDTVTVHY